jgi:hypothetical protein
VDDEDGNDKVLSTAHTLILQLPPQA